MADKTNAVRMLDRLQIPYQLRAYTGAISGVEVAAALGEDPAAVFKTLVTTGHTGGQYVFIIPAAGELDLKKAAAAAGEKSIAMLPARELLPRTGYIHGGCSPVGMKKPFPTFLHHTAAGQPVIFVSAGRIGLQLAISPADLGRAVPLCLADLTRG